MKAFAEGLMQLKAAPPVAEYYNGPILFEGGAVATILANNLLYRGGLIAARSLMLWDGDWRISSVRRSWTSA